MCIKQMHFMLVLPYLRAQKERKWGYWDCENKQTNPQAKLKKFT